MEVEKEGNSLQVEAYSSPGDRRVILKTGGFMGLVWLMRQDPFKALKGKNEELFEVKELLISCIAGLVCTKQEAGVQ